MLVAFSAVGHSRQQVVVVCHVKVTTSQQQRGNFPPVLAQLVQHYIALLERL
jgi:hypothetical protein